MKWKILSLENESMDYVQNSMIFVLILVALKGASIAEISSDSLKPKSPDKIHTFISFNDDLPK